MDVDADDEQVNLGPFKNVPPESQCPTGHSLDWIWKRLSVGPDSNTVHVSKK
jgi:hypothetical protein